MKRYEGNMLDVAIALRRYSFLGPEFLTWLWYLIENEPETIEESVREPVTITVGNRIGLEKRFRDDTEKISIRGDAATMDEAVLSLKKGAVVTEIHLEMEIGEIAWSFAVKGETLALSTLRVPSTGPVRESEEIEGAVLEKASLMETPINIMDALFRHFIRLRVTEKWQYEEVPKVNKWIEAERL